MKQTIILMLIQAVTMFVMSIFEQVSTTIPTPLQEWKKEYLDKKIENTINIVAAKKETLADVSINLDNKHDNNTVIIIRKWNGSEKSSSGKDAVTEVDESKEIADALLSHIASAENIPTLQLTQSSQFIINYKETPIEILPGIYVKIDEFKMDSETLKMQHLVLRVSSNIHNTKYIKETLENMRIKWIADQQNKLGNSLWYFEQKVRAGRSMGWSAEDPSASERMRMEKILSAPPVIQYEMRPFHSNKSFDN